MRKCLLSFLFATILVFGRGSLIHAGMLSPDPVPKLIVGVKGGVYYYDPDVYYVDEGGHLRDISSHELEWQNHVTDRFEPYRTNCIDILDQGWTIEGPTDITVFTYLVDVDIHLVASNCDVSPSFGGRTGDYRQEPAPAEQADGYLASYFIWNLSSAGSPGWESSFTEGGKDFYEHTGRINSSYDCELWAFADYTGDHFYTCHYSMSRDPDHEPFTPKSCNTTYCVPPEPSHSPLGLALLILAVAVFFGYVIMKRRKTGWMQASGF